MSFLKTHFGHCRPASHSTSSVPFSERSDYLKLEREMLELGLLEGRQMDLGKEESRKATGTVRLLVRVTFAGLRIPVHRCVLVM